MFTALCSGPTVLLIATASQLSWCGNYVLCGGSIFVFFLSIIEAVVEAMVLQVRW